MGQRAWQSRQTTLYRHRNDPTIEMISATEVTPNTTEMIPTTEMMPAVTTEMMPGISGMELRGLQKLDKNLVRAFYLFILHHFYGV